MVNNSPGMMIEYLVILLVVLVAGCSTIKTDLKESETLHDKIRSGAIVKPGDRVRITTINGDKQVITVTSLDQETLSGNEVAYISDRAAVVGKKREVDTLDKATTIDISINRIVSLVSEQIYTERETDHATNTLMLAVFGFLIVLAWALP